MRRRLDDRQPAELIRRAKFAKDLERAAAADRRRSTSTGIVIGLPLNLDGSESPAHPIGPRLRPQPRRRSACPILLWDERWSTQAVTRTLIDADASRARRAELVDKMAAAYILQGAIDALTWA